MFSDKFKETYNDGASLEFQSKPVNYKNEQVVIVCCCSFSNNIDKEDNDYIFGNTYIKTYHATAGLLFSSENFIRDLLDDLPFINRNSYMYGRFNDLTKTEVEKIYNFLAGINEEPQKQFNYIDPKNNGVFCRACGNFEFYAEKDGLPDGKITCYNCKHSMRKFRGVDPSFREAFDEIYGKIGKF